eukprot:6491542-Amphidinium_carterae.1
MAIRSGSEQPSQPVPTNSCVVSHVVSHEASHIPIVSPNSSAVSHEASHTPIVSHDSCVTTYEASHTPAVHKTDTNVRREVWLLGGAPEVAQALSQHTVAVTTHLQTPQSFTSGRAVNAVLALHTQKQPSAMWLRLPPQISIAGTSKDRRRGKHIVQLITAQVNTGHALFVDGVTTLATWQQPGIQQCLFSPAFQHFDTHHEKRPWRCVVSGANMPLSTDTNMSFSVLLSACCLCNDDGSGAELKANSGSCPPTHPEASCACSSAACALVASA